MVAKSSLALYRRIQFGMDHGGFGIDVDSTLAKWGGEEKGVALLDESCSLRDSKSSGHEQPGGAILQAETEGAQGGSTYVPAYLTRAWDCQEVFQDLT